MSETETEAETLERLEAALLRIAHLARPQSQGGSHDIDRAALIKSLDSMISRLRAGLIPPNGNPHTPE
jgi:hypothetical protein